MQEKNTDLTLEQADKKIKRNKAKSKFIGFLFLFVILVIGVYF